MRGEGEGGGGGGGVKGFGKDVVKILAEREPDTAAVLIRSIFAV